MAGAVFEFQLKEVEALSSLLNKMKLTAAQENELLGSIGLELEAQMIERITDTKTDPDGERWDDIKESTRKLYQRYNKDTSYQRLLHRKGGLRDSVESQARRGSVLVGATKMYAGYLNDGTSRMVARRFVGIGQTDVQILVETVSTYMEGLLNEPGNLG